MLGPTPGGHLGKEAGDPPEDRLNRPRQHPEGGDDGQRDDGKDDRVLSRGLSFLTLDPKANELLIR